MKKINIVGVPEHFNLPWHLCIEDGEFEAVGIDLQWKDVPEGTGKMCEMLREGKTDIAVVLTEGIIKDIAAGNPSKIVQMYVESPLVWGIHVAANAPFNAISELENQKIAISRFGSGSHLMSILNAKSQNWDTENLNFEVVNTIEGAVESLQAGKSASFMWEKFMTQPLVDQGVFRRLGVFPTPWPCFVIAVRNEILEQAPEIINQILEIINITTTDFKHIPSIDKTLAIKYNQELSQIQEWLKITKWSQKQLKEETASLIMEQLLQINSISSKVATSLVLK